MKVLKFICIVISFLFIFSCSSSYIEKIQNLKLTQQNIENLNIDKIDSLKFQEFIDDISKIHAISRGYNAYQNHIRQMNNINTENIILIDSTAMKEYEYNFELEKQLPKLQAITFGTLFNEYDLLKSINSDYDNRIESIETELINDINKPSNLFIHKYTTRYDVEKPSIHLEINLDNAIYSNIIIGKLEFHEKNTKVAELEYFSLKEGMNYFYFGKNVNKEFDILKNVDFDNCDLKIIPNNIRDQRITKLQNEKWEKTRRMCPNIMQLRSVNSTFYKIKINILKY